jgi:putative toxin-antitoxin system antitoxin component (TIGR02293 family)
MLYIYNINAAIMKKENKTRKSFDPRESIRRAKSTNKPSVKWRLESEGREYIWTSKLERVGIIREGIPYASIDVISKRINVPIKEVLHIFGLPQTTYNKKRREKSLLNGRDSEIILLLTELVDFGIEVFNNEEEKFQRWMKKQNISLGGNSPESLLDSITGIQEVKNCLNRIEFGNLA